MQQRRIDEIKAIILLALSIIIIMSLVSFTPDDLAFYTSHPNSPPANLIKGFGAYLAGVLLFFIGWSSWLLPAFIIFWSVRLFQQKEVDFRFVRMFGFLILILSVCSTLAMLAGGTNTNTQFSHGGLFGYILSRFVETYFGKIGAYIIFFTLIFLSLALVTDILISTIFIRFVQRLKIIAVKYLFKTRRVASDKKTIVSPRIKTTVTPVVSSAQRLPKQRTLATTTTGPISEKPPQVKIQIAKPPQRQPAVAIEAKETGGTKDYRLPPLDLLKSPPPFAERKIKEDLEGSARILEDTLADFGVVAKVTNIERGPVITRYELEPAPGVKLNRIVSLSDDIALAMKAQSARIVAPIPGKGRVGVEIPNIQGSLVYLKEVLMSQEFQNASYRLPLGLGKDIAGKPVVADLSQMPHLLIAGTTGSGKTICVNCLILSILFHATPEDVKLLMVDPKMVELAPFNHLPHLLCPVVTQPKKAAGALAWVVNEMERRYQLLARAGRRNIEAYNQNREKIPYIIVIIDELADLMATAPDQVEGAITRLAQLSRAVGIHLVLVTQRPSVDVITGVIKANFPARISFQVASKVDSRTVLDTNGADKLLGKGDMLFLKPGESKLIRAQGSLVSDKEIEQVVDFIKSQRQPIYDEEIVKEQQKTNLRSNEKDELYDEAVRLVMETGQASVSILQRRIRLGYTRAARIIDTMEQEGLIGPFEGSKPRQILVDREEWLRERTLPKPEGEGQV